MKNLSLELSNSENYCHAYSWIPNLQTINDSCIVTILKCFWKLWQKEWERLIIKMHICQGLLIFFLITSCLVWALIHKYLNDTLRNRKLHWEACQKSWPEAGFCWEFHINMQEKKQLHLQRLPNLSS